MAVLRGITWDHPRGYQPLHAVAGEWKNLTGKEVAWDVRSLKDFGDKPIEDLITEYDLVVLDHPYMGEAASNQLLIPLDQHLSDSFIQIQRTESVGSCFSSYQYDRHFWAMPLDAAAQVAAYRQDLISTIKWPLPKDLLQLSNAAQLLPSRYKIAVPLCPTDIWCVFLTLCAQYSNGIFFFDEKIEEETGVWALKQIFSWKEFLFKGSFNMNPVQLLEHMSSRDDIVYVPFTFGYTNYSRKNFREKLVHFTNVPRYNQSTRSSILGGAGLAISSRTQHVSDCVEFLQFVLSRDIQAGTYYTNGGQPAHLQAWMNPDNDADCANFFSNTIMTMENAYVRPRRKGFNIFQERAADFIHHEVCIETSPETIMQQLNKLYQEVLNGKI